MRHLPLVLVLLASGASCAAPVLAAKAAPPAAATAPGFQRGGSLPKWASPLAEPPPTQRSDSLVMRLWEVQAVGGAAPAVLVNQALQVNDREALSVIGQHSFTYNPAYEKVRLLRVAILRGGATIDRTAKVNVRLLEREEALDAGVYGGEKTVQLLLDDVRVGDTLWLTYLTEGSNPVFGQRLDRRFALAHAAPVELRRITVLYPAGDAVQWRQLAPGMAAADRVASQSPADNTDAAPADPIAPLVDQVGAFKRVRFEMRAIDAVEPEQRVPGSVQMLPLIQLSQYPGWQAVAAWAAQLFPPAAPTASLKNLAARLERDAGAGPDDMARAGAALRYVQDEIRYFSVSMGENSHRPQPPEVVLARGYGDCKDKSYLLVSLLAQMGIAAHPVLLNSQTGQLATTMLPSPTAFDHAVVRIDLGGKQYFVDATRSGQRGRLDTLPAIFPGASGLLVDAATTELLSFPPDPDSTPQFELAETLKLAAFDADATLDARLLYRGNYAEWARRHYGAASPAQIKREALARYEKPYPGATLLAAPVLREKPQGVVELAIQLKLPKPVTTEDDVHGIEYDTQVMDDTLAIPPKVVRQFPLQLPQGAYRGRYRLTLHWPEQVATVDHPVASTLDTPWFRAHEEYSVRANVIEYALDYRLKHDAVAAADVPGLSRQSKALSKLATGGWRIGEPALRESAYARFPLRDYWMAQDAEVLDTGWGAVAPGAYSRARCYLALAASRVRLAQAPHDSEELARYSTRLAALPDSVELRVCLLRLAYIESRFADAVALAGNAETFNATVQIDPSSSIAVAWARQLSGDGAGARAAMGRYLDERSAAGTLTAQDAVHAFALYRRSGAQAPASLAAFAREMPDGPWPRPLLAWQAGLMDEAALLAVVESMPASARELAREDQWFFQGQALLALGERGGASVAFRRVIERGTVRSLVTPLARFELAALGQSGHAELAAAAARMKQAFALLNAPTRPRQIDEVIRLGLLADAAGNFEAADLLGAVYSDNSFVPADPARAEAYMLRAVANGSLIAPRNLALLQVHDAPGKPRDLDKGIETLRLGASRNDSGTQAILSAVFYEGILTPPDYVQAWYWAKRGAQRGDTGAATMLAKMLAGGKGVPMDKAQAATFLRQNIATGDTESMLQLADMLEQDKPSARDRREARELMERASEAGSTRARVLLGLRMVQGADDPSEAAAGVALLEKAAAGGDPDAAQHLAWAFFSGKAGSTDAVRAEGYLRACAEKGAASCQSAYAAELHNGKNLKRDDVSAAAWYAKAAAQNWPVALNNLGDMIENGQGVPQDYAQARGLYRRAAQRCLPVGFVSLGYLHEMGLGVPASAQMAYTMYRTAEQCPADTQGTPAARERRLALAGRIDERDRREAEAAALRWRPGQPLPDDAVAPVTPAAPARQAAAAQGAIAQ
ncbi:MAG: DUF3857 domain-containing protein [Massilia sp.]